MHNSCHTYIKPLVLISCKALGQPIQLSGLMTLEGTLQPSSSSSITTAVPTYLFPLMKLLLSVYR